MSGFEPGGGLLSFKPLSSGEAVVSEIEDVGPVRVCVQCFWGQSQVSAFFNHSLGVTIASDEQHSPFKSIPDFKKDFKEHLPEAINLRLYGKLTMCQVTPVFAIKTRRHDRSVVYVNICSCSEVPYNDHDHNAYGNDDIKKHVPSSASPRVIYMVSGPAVHLKSYIESDGEAHVVLQNDTEVTVALRNSIYDIAVHPRVIHEAIQDRTYSQFALISEQALSLLVHCCGEHSFSRYQFTSGEAEGHYVTHESIHRAHHMSDGRTSQTERPSESNETATSIAAIENKGDNQPHTLSLLQPSSIVDSTKHYSPNTPSPHSHSPLLAIPSPLAFRKLHHIAAKPEDLSERPVNAESEAEFDNYSSSPCSSTGKNMSMVHQLMMQQQLSRKSDGTPPSGGSRSRNHSDDKLVSDHPADASHHTLEAHTKSLTMIPNAGFVIKTKRAEDGEDSLSIKVFINVLHHTSVDELLASQTVTLKQSEKPLIIFAEGMSHTRDKDGQNSVLYNVAVGSEYFALPLSAGVMRITDLVYIKKIISAVSLHYGDSLSPESYSLPKLKCGFKGDGIELTTFTFSTVASDPVVALVHDLNALKINQQRAVQEGRSGSDKDSVGCCSHSHEKHHTPRSSCGGKEEHVRRLSGIAFEELTASLNGDDDGQSVMSELTHDWQDDRDQDSEHSLRSSSPGIEPGSGSARRRSTLRLSIFGPSTGGVSSVTNEGRALFTGDDMLQFIGALSVTEGDARRLKGESIVDPRILLGWQMVFPKRGQKHSSLSLFVVTGVRKNKLTRKTEYRISSREQDDFWTQLKRSDAKSGVVF
eukprot:gene30954-38254_t